MGSGLGTVICGLFFLFVYPPLGIIFLVLGFFMAISGGGRKQ